MKERESKVLFLTFYKRANEHFEVHNSIIKLLKSLRTQTPKEIEYGQQRLKGSEVDLRRKFIDISRFYNCTNLSTKFS